ncbi:MAG: hypothetical protein GF308_16145 [Candidatus Heimdallarchaeota archaeon]|nr:hypothetical protein [Candidatus Heimdallarchaeota archaeon]
MNKGKIQKIIKKNFKSFNSRYIFSLIADQDFCTRNELIKWTGFSKITIDKYLQRFSKARLINNAPGIVYVSDLGEQIYSSFYDFFKMHNKIS